MTECKCVGRLKANGPPSVAGWLGEEGQSRTSCLSHSLSVTPPTFQFSPSN